MFPFLMWKKCLNRTREKKKDCAVEEAAFVRVSLFFCWFWLNVTKQQWLWAMSQGAGSLGRGSDPQPWTRQDIVLPESLKATNGAAEAAFPFFSVCVSCFKRSFLLKETCDWKIKHVVEGWFVNAFMPWLIRLCVAFSVARRWFWDQTKFR